MTNTDRLADADALGLLLELLEQGVIPHLLDRQQPPYMAAVVRARALRGLILAGRVMVLDAPAARERGGR